MVYMYRYEEINALRLKNVLFSHLIQLHNSDVLTEYTVACMANTDLI